MRNQKLWQPQPELHQRQEGAEGAYPAFVAQQDRQQVDTLAKELRDLRAQIEGLTEAVADCLGGVDYVADLAKAVFEAFFDPLNPNDARARRALEQGYTHVSAMEYGPAEGSLVKFPPNNDDEPADTKQKPKSKAR